MNCTTLDSILVEKEPRRGLVVITDGEPDDLLALMLLFHNVKYDAKDLFVLASLRNADDTASVVQKVVDHYFPNLHVHVGKSGLKEPFIDRSGKIIDPDFKDQNPRDCVHSLLEFINFDHDKTDVILLAPALDFSPFVLEQLDPRRLGQMWSWGGPFLSVNDEVLRVKIDLPCTLPMNHPSHSFNWRVETKSISNLLLWCQVHKINHYVSTPTIYKTCIPPVPVKIDDTVQSLILHIHEADPKCASIVKKLKESKSSLLNVVRTW